MFPNASALFALNGDSNNTAGYTTAMVAGLESFSVSSQEKKWNNDNNALTFNGILACMFHPFCSLSLPAVYMDILCTLSISGCHHSL